MSVWIALALIAWLVLATVVAFGVGAVIRNRDRQAPQPAYTIPAQRARRNGRVATVRSYHETASVGDDGSGAGLDPPGRGRNAADY